MTGPKPLTAADWLSLRPSPTARDATQVRDLQPFYRRPPGVMSGPTPSLREMTPELAARGMYTGLLGAIPSIGTMGVDIANWIDEARWGGPVAPSMTEALFTQLRKYTGTEQIAKDRPDANFVNEMLGGIVGPAEAFGAARGYGAVLKGIREAHPPAGFAGRFLSAMERADAPVRTEIEGFAETTPEEFEQAVSGFQKEHPGKAAFLTPRTAEQMRAEGMRVFLNPEGTVGYAVEPTSGDIRNVFNHGGRKGEGAEAVIDAVHNRGGKILDAFDTDLTSIYRDLGFKETWRSKWNDEYRPPGWDEAKFGQPDVIGMEYAGPSSASEQRAAYAAARQARSGKPEPGILGKVSQSLKRVLGDEAGAVPAREFIVKASTRFKQPNGKYREVDGLDHGQIEETIAEKGYEETEGYEFGFRTSLGRWVTRKEAAEIAERSRQIHPEHRTKDSDYWPGRGGLSTESMMDPAGGYASDTPLYRLKKLMADAKKSLKSIAGDERGELFPKPKSVLASGLSKDEAVAFMKSTTTPAQMQRLPDGTFQVIAKGPPQAPNPPKVEVGNKKDLVRRQLGDQAEPFESGFQSRMLTVLDHGDWPEEGLTLKEWKAELLKHPDVSKTEVEAAFTSLEESKEFKGRKLSEVLKNDPEFVAEMTEIERQYDEAKHAIEQESVARVQARARERGEAVDHANPQPWVLEENAALERGLNNLSHRFGQDRDAARKAGELRAQGLDREGVEAVDEVEARYRALREDAETRAARSEEFMRRQYMDTEFPSSDEQDRAARVLNHKLDISASHLHKELDDLMRSREAELADARKAMQERLASRKLAAPAETKYDARDLSRELTDHTPVKDLRVEVEEATGGQELTQDMIDMEAQYLAESEREYRYGEAQSHINDRDSALQSLGELMDRALGEGASRAVKSTLEEVNDLNANDYALFPEWDDFEELMRSSSERSDYGEGGVVPDEIGTRFLDALLRKIGIDDPAQLRLDDPFELRPPKAVDAGVYQGMRPALSENDLSELKRYVREATEAQEEAVREAGHAEDPDWDDLNQQAEERLREDAAYEVSDPGNTQHSSNQRWDESTPYREIVIKHPEAKGRSGHSFGDRETFGWARAELHDQGDLFVAIEFQNDIQKRVQRSGQGVAKDAMDVLADNERWVQTSVGAALLNAAEDAGVKRFGWVTGANRARYASFSLEAGENLYDTAVPKAIRRIFRWLNLPEPKIERLGSGHDSHFEIELPLAIKKKLRQHGVPALGIAGLSVVAADGRQGVIEIGKPAKEDR